MESVLYLELHESVIAHGICADEPVGRVFYATSADKDDHCRDAIENGINTSETIGRGRIPFFIECTNDSIDSIR